MRKMLQLLPAAAILAIALPAAAQLPMVGIVTEGCGPAVNPTVGTTNRAELYGWKVPASGDCTDMQFSLASKALPAGSLDSGLDASGDASGVLWSLGSNFRAPPAATDTRVAILVYPPEVPNGGYRFAIDSDIPDEQDLYVNMRQTLGNSILNAVVPNGVYPPTLTGTAGGAITTPGGTVSPIDLTLPVGGGTYGVKLGGRANIVDPLPFPTFGARAATPAVLSGIGVAFAPLVEVNDGDWTATQCSVAGRVGSQVTGSPAGQDGIIIGYNVYRRIGVAGTPPTAADFYADSIDADPATGWQYFIPMTASFTVNAPDVPFPGGAGFGTPAATDSLPNDLGGLQNPDGIFGTGDEVLIFQDSLANRGVGRFSGTAPTQGTSYWYAMQPVVCGTVAAMATAAFPCGAGCAGGHASSVSALGAGDDAINLDNTGTIEFFSPQADAGLPGLGLTYKGLPAISAPIFALGSTALPATGDVTLTGTMSGATVNIMFQTGLQVGNVQGFNVYRGTGDASVRVNEQLILAQGTESSVYQLVDDAVQARRLSKSGSVQYMVEIVYADGRTSMVGPFAVAVERQAPTRRAR